MSDAHHHEREIGVKHAVTPLELFFDLVFVLAITQVAGRLHDDHTASGWAHAALLLWLVWWAWFAIYLWCVVVGLESATRFP